MPTYYFGEGLSGPIVNDPNSKFGFGGHTYSSLDAGLQEIPKVYLCLSNGFTDETSTSTQVVFGGVEDIASFKEVDTAELGGGEFWVRYNLTAGSEGAIVRVDSVTFQFTYEFDVSAAQPPTDPVLSYSSLNGVATGNGVIVAAGAQSSIWYSTNQGQTWAQAVSPEDSTYRDVLFDGAKFYICGTGGVLIESVDGINWATTRKDRTTDFIDLALVRGGDVLSIGTDETMVIKDKLASNFDFLNRTQL